MKWGHLAATAICNNDNIYGFLFIWLGSPWHIDIMSSPGFTPLGESSRLVPAKSPAVFEILPPPGSTLNREDCVASVLSPSKSKVNARITHEAANGAMRIEFVPTEVGTHVSPSDFWWHSFDLVAYGIFWNINFYAVYFRLLKHQLVVQN